MFRLLFLFPLFLFLGCEKGAPVIDQEAILLISASPSSIYNFGDTSIITVQAVEADGRPVLDGTSLQFTATGGSLDSNAKTINGQAQTVFTSDAEISDVTITVQSGTLGGDGSISTVISVLDRNIAIGNTTLGLNPSNINQAGGVVQVSITVQDPGGIPIPNKSVVFSSTFGTLASNGLARKTNSSGQAFDSLQLQDIPAGLDAVVVTAIVGTQTVESNITISQNQNPLSEFTFSPDIILVGDEVYFNGTESTDPDGYISSWEWYFGDGQSASGETVSHVFSLSGSYKTTLKVTDNRGSSVSSSQSITIGDNELPVADFSFSPSNPRVRDKVLFNGQSSFDSDGQIVSYEWQFLSGITREGPTVSYAFAGAGTFVVSLTVTDNSGGKNTYSQQITVDGNIPPNADFIFSPSDPREGDTVTFDASISSDPDGSVISYQWNFGNGSTGDSVAWTTLFSNPGYYLVQLTARDNDGGLGFSQKTVRVTGNNGPEAMFSFTPSSPKINESVSFNGAESSDPDGHIVSYKWDFGDGGTSSGATTTHTFRSPGSYPVSLTVKDDDWESDVTAQQVDVNQGGIPNPVLLLVPQTLTPPSGLVLLDGSDSTDPEDALADLHFTVEAFAPSHVTVDLPNEFGPVRQADLSGLELGDQVIFVMTVRDQDGNKNSTTQVLTASDGPVNQPPVAVCSVTPTSLEVPGGNVILDATGSSDPDHTSSSLTYQFEAQTSGNVMVQMDPIQVGPLQSAIISNGTVGDMVAFLLTVTDPLGAQAWQSKFVSIVAAPGSPKPQAKLTLSSPKEIRVSSLKNGSLDLVLDGTSSQNTDDDYNSLKWLFQGFPSRKSISIQIQPSVTEKGKAIAQISSLKAGDQISFVLMLKNKQGLTDFSIQRLRIVE